MIGRATILLGLLVVAVALVVVRAGGPDDRAYRAAAEFDTAKGIVPGQLVKIAGARAGKVRAVHLTPRHTARIEFTVDARFGPFRSDATCRILPEGLISENYVDCDPGSPGAAPLRAAPLPTVPLARTSAPISLQDVLDTFDLPAAQRVSLLLTNLGLGTSGRGSDINGILRRANPALQEAQDVLREISAQRGSIADAVGQTDRVLADLADRRRDVRRFVRGAAVTVSATAARPKALSETVRRLPAMLGETRAGLRAIDEVTADATPLVADLRAAAPRLKSFLDQLLRFSTAGTPAVRAVAATARRTRRALPDIEPVARDLSRLADTTAPMLRQLGVLLPDLRNSGTAEGILSFFYALSVSTSLYDSVSHYFSLFVGLAPQCIVSSRTDPVPGCDRTYDKPQIPMNDPDSRGRQSRAVVRALEKGPQTRSPLEAAARKLFLSDKFAGKDGRPDSDHIIPLLDYLLG